MVNFKNKYMLLAPVGAVSNRTALAPLETAPIKRQNSRGGFLTAPVWSVSLILRSTINKTQRREGTRLQRKYFASYRHSVAALDFSSNPDWVFGFWVA